MPLIEQAYWHWFHHDAWPKDIMIPGNGTTPCRAKAHAWDRFGTYIRVTVETDHPEIPQTDWRLVNQELV